MPSPDIPAIEARATMRDLDLADIATSEASPDLKAAAILDLMAYGPHVARMTLGGHDWSQGTNFGGWHADGCIRDGNCGC